MTRRCLLGHLMRYLRLQLKVMGPPYLVGVALLSLVEQAVPSLGPRHRVADPPYSVAMPLDLVGQAP